jgi:hypothetical protein
VESQGREHPSIEERKAQLELFFWAARQALMLVVLAALTVYLVVSLAEGRFPDELLRYQEPWALPPG